MLSDEKYRRQMIDTTITLFPLLLMAYYYYGLRVLVMAAISVLTTAAADYLCLLLQGKRWWKKYDFAPLIIGLTYVLMLPASAPYWLVIFGALFAIFVVRHPFGGHYHTLFNPALTAFAFVVVCWNSLTTKYPQMFTRIPLTPEAGVPVFDSPAYRLMLGGGENIGLLDALLGNFTGPMGTTCVAVLLCCGAYLIFRGTILWQIPVASLTIVGLAAWFFPRINGSRMVSLLMELTSEVMLFAILFVAAMDNGELRTAAGKWFYGVILGGFIVLFRRFSYIELVSPYAIIIMNTIDHRCDAYAQKTAQVLAFCMAKSGQGVLAAARAAGKHCRPLLKKAGSAYSRWLDGSGKEGK